MTTDGTISQVPDSGSTRLDGTGSDGSVSNVRSLRLAPPVQGDPCAMCGSRQGTVRCSFAFERVHRRVPLCREHRQPLVEIDFFTRPPDSEAQDVPATWAARPPLGGDRRAGTGPRRRGAPMGVLVPMPQR